MNPGQLRRLRLRPLNRIAALKLKVAGLGERPDDLPVFQLMEWGLAQGVRLTHPRTAAELQRLRLHAEPERAYRYLIENIPGELRRFEQLLLRLVPLSAAEVLLDLLDMRLKADPCQPYPEQRD